MKKTLSFLMFSTAIFSASAMSMDNAPNAATTDARQDNHSGWYATRWSAFEGVNAPDGFVIVDKDNQLTQIGEGRACQSALPDYDCGLVEVRYNLGEFSDPVLADIVTQAQNSN
uniref:hypothetical protein n=1 Tax=Thaumasiovibrio occultus TaxID=1891184 RepID=UPI000B35DE9F|nr:hypothetical protein [Thaumasiovibrio occultus]